MKKQITKDKAAAKLKVAIHAWRGNKKTHRMPELLWQKAAHLAQQYTVSKVATYLGLDSASLRPCPSDGSSWVCRAPAAYASTPCEQFRF